VPVPSITVDPALRVVDGEVVFDPTHTARRWRWLQWITTWGFWVLVTIEIGASMIEGHWGTGAIVMDVCFVGVIASGVLLRRENRKRPRPTGPFVVPTGLLEEAGTMHAAGNRAAAARLVRDRTSLGLTDSLALARLAAAEQR
jgi:hypothetical protein